MAKTYKNEVAMSGEYNTGKDGCYEAFDQLRRIAEAELKTLYQSIEDRKKKSASTRDDKSDRAMGMLLRIAKEDLKGLEELIKERKKR